MAKVKFGTVIADIRGSIGGITYSKNAFGAYAKTKVSPTQPETSKQTNIRAIFSDLTKRWSGLTQIKRDGWTTLGTNYGEPDGFGNTKPITGLAAYCRSNITLINNNTARVDDPPSDMNVTGTTVGIDAFSKSNVPPGTNLVFTFSPAIPSSNKLLCYATRKLLPSINNFNSELVYIGYHEFGAASPATFLYPDTLSVLGSNENIGILLVSLNTTNGAMIDVYKANTILTPYV